MAWPIAMDLAMQVPRWAGHDKEIRRPQRIAARNDVRRSEFEYGRQGPNLSCHEKLRRTRPCAPTMSRSRHSQRGCYGHASTGVVRWAYYIPRACVSPCRRWHLEMFVSEDSSEVTVAPWIYTAGCEHSVGASPRTPSDPSRWTHGWPTWMRWGLAGIHRSVTVFWWILTKTGSYRRIYAYKACILAKTGKNVKLADFRSSWGSRWWRWSGLPIPAI